MARRLTPKGAGRSPASIRESLVAHGAVADSRSDSAVSLDLGGGVAGVAARAYGERCEGSDRCCSLSSGPPSQPPATG